MKKKQIPRLMGKKKRIPLRLIRTDGDTQRRETLHRDIVAEYAETWREGIAFPPVRAIFDGEWYWLWDGFYRVESARQAGLNSVEVRFGEGTQEDAQWLSCCANRRHGVRRTHAEKEASVRYALNHTYGIGLSNVEIAQFVGSSPQTVQKIRRHMEANRLILRSRYSATMGERVVSCQMEEEWVAKRAIVPPTSKRRAKEIAKDGLPKPPQLMDETGSLVPADLNVVFENLFEALTFARNVLRDTHHGLKRALDLVDLHRILNGPKRVKLEMYLHTLDDLIEEGDRLKPYAVCACAGKPPVTCERCGSERWLSKSEYQTKSRD
jgi:DNA-binding Lrp family transcriptional regulator